MRIHGSSTSPSSLSSSVRPRGGWWLLPALLAVGSAAAQVPDGYVVFGSFQGTTGTNGLFFAHPRDPQSAWIPVTNLPAALGFDPLGRRGVAAVLRRPDGTLLAGERSPIGTSVDVHLLRLSGASVTFAQLFSVGTSANVGEIPQLGLLPDGRVVVAATDLTAGSPLAQFQTSQFNWEGIGILDVASGGVVPIAIPNLNQFPGVINGIAVSADGQTIYVGNWVSATSGDLWSVPVSGGAATQIATFPSGPSNVAVDLDGSVLVTTLNGPPNLFRVAAAPPHAVTVIPTTHGPMNAVEVETVTGNYFVATANAGVPVRSLLWMTPTGSQETVLQSPNLATISAIAHNPDPEAYGAAATGLSDYRWLLAPNAGGLPEVGNAGFSLTMNAAPTEPLLAFFFLSTGTVTGITFQSLPIHIDFGNLVLDRLLISAGGPVTVPLGIPNDNGLRGIAVFGQILMQEVTTQAGAASPGVEITVL